MEIKLYLQLLATLLTLAMIHGQFTNQDFGNTLENCLEPITRPRNFCRRRSQNPEAPNSIVRYRTITGICNNLLRGRATVGAGGTVTPRFFKRARYFDRDVFDEGDGLDTPLGHPSLPKAPFGFGFKSAQEVSDIVFNINNTDNGNNRRVSHLYMTFGQFMDHDFAYILHPSSSSSGCKARCDPARGDFNRSCFPIREGRRPSQCVSFVRSFPVCQGTKREERNQISNITSYIDGSMIYGSTDFVASRVRDGNLPYLRVRKTRVGDLLPPDPLSGDPCTEIDGCVLAGDTRVNENTALAAMHTVWVRLHNVYAKVIDQLGRRKPRDFPTIARTKRNRNTIIFEEARKIVIAILQHIFYDEWLPKIVSVPAYKGYNRRVRAEVRQAFATAAFRFGHTLVRNKFERVNSDYTRSRDGPLFVRASFNNNRPINRRGIEPIMQGLFANDAEAEDFDNTFSGSIGRTLFIRPRQSGFQNLLALNIQRGRDHGLQSYTAYRKLCGIPNAIRRGSNPFSIFRNTITNPEILKDLRRTYGRPENHIDFFAAAISETNDGPKLLGRTFGCILSRTFQALRDGDRFYYENKDVVTISQQKEVKKMNIARVMCLTLKNLRDIQESPFDVFVPSRRNRRISCRTLLEIENLNVEVWLKKSKIKI